MHVFTVADWAGDILLRPKLGEGDDGLNISKTKWVFISKYYINRVILSSTRRSNI